MIMLFMFYLIVLCHNTAAESPKFRILAPPFVCPEDEDGMVSRPENTVITLQTEVPSNIEYRWTVRWVPMAATTQRVTVMLWRSVRKLENKLNGEQIEPNTFHINNSELLPGVRYTFNVTGTLNEEASTTKSFQIDNIKGDRKLLIEGRSDMFAVLLVGAPMVYTDMMYIVEAQVTSCYQMWDYYFSWTVESEFEDKVNVSNVKGSWLEIPKDVLKPVLYYNVDCKVQKDSTGDVIAKASMSFRTLRRDQLVSLNVDTMRVTVHKPFKLTAMVNTIENVNLTWACNFTDEPFDIFEAGDNGTINFPQGLPSIGTYHLCVSARIAGYAEAAFCAKIIAVETSLPVLQVAPIPRIVNEDTLITLAANASDVNPGCTLAWYFASADCVTRNDSGTDYTCGHSRYGVLISEPMTVYSMEETFLNELTDFSNETERLLLTGMLKAEDGTARLVADCNCYQSINCTEKGIGLAEVNFHLNIKPDVGQLKISPESGIAVETVFRISTLASKDPNRPLKYNFYCNIGANDSILLGSQLDYLSVESLLPYIDGGIPVWVEVCDSLGACAAGTPTIVDIDPGEARTVKALIEDTHAHLRRYEKIQLQKLVAFSIVSYTNAGQVDALSLFTEALKTMVKNIEDNESGQYFIHLLGAYGVLN